MTVPTEMTKINHPSPKKRAAEGKRQTIINTIFGGPSGGHSGNKRKGLIREAQHKVNTSYTMPTVALTFYTEDLERIHLPHNDALVIASVIDNVNVKRVLIHLPNSFSGFLMGVSCSRRLYQFASSHRRGKR